MDTLKKVIQNIFNWQQLTPGQILTRLEEKTIHYVDPRQYRLVDVAKLIGDENMATFLSVVKSAGYDWMITEAASGFTPGDDPINSRLRLLGHPLSLQIANHTNRMISVLEQNGLNPTEDEIEDARQSLKHEQRQQALLSQGADVWNAFVGAVDNLQPGDSDPVLVMQHALAEPVL